MNQRMGLIMALACLLMALFAPVGQAAPMFTLDFSAGDISGNATVTVSGASSPFTVTAITGSILAPDVDPSPLTITGLSNYAGAQNTLLLPGPPFVSFGGLSFSTALSDFNLASNPDIINVSFFNPNGVFPPPDPRGTVSGLTITVTPATPVTPVPEPMTMVAFGMCLAGGGAYASYRRRKLG